MKLIDRTINPNDPAYYDNRQVVEVFICPLCFDAYDKNGEPVKIDLDDDDDEIKQVHVSKLCKPCQNSQDNDLVNRE